MPLPAFPSPDQNWDILRGGPLPEGTSAGYLLLLSAIDLGWQIRQPVRLVPNPIHPERFGYRFSLERQPGRQKRELALAYSPDLENYLADEHFAVRIMR